MDDSALPNGGYFKDFGGLKAFIYLAGGPHWTVAACHRRTRLSAARKLPLPANSRLPSEISELVELTVGANVNPS